MCYIDTNSKIEWTNDVHMNLASADSSGDDLPRTCARWHPQGAKAKDPSKSSDEEHSSAPGLQ